MVVYGMQCSLYIKEFHAIYVIYCKFLVCNCGTVHCNTMTGYVAKTSSMSSMTNISMTRAALC